MTFDWRTDWKRSVLWGASFGIAAALTLSISLAVIYWCTSRPKAWNVNAIKGISSTADEYFDLDNNKFKGGGFRAVFVIENTTSADITLPQDLRFYKREMKSQALEEIKLTLIHQFVIPARERAEITAHMEYSCSESDLDTGVTTEREGKQCFQDAIGDVSEFVAFDNTSHIRLNLPKPVFYAGKEATRDLPPASAAVAPDHGDSYDRLWACSEARRLAPICKRDKIELGEERVATNGWTVAGPLPTLPIPPKGYLMEPGSETCKIIYQWAFYCRRNLTTK
jgi:hypothetical protein